MITGGSSCSSDESTSISGGFGNLRETERERDGGLVGLLDRRDLDVAAGLVVVEASSGELDWSWKKGQGRPDLASRLRCSSLYPRRKSRQARLWRGSKGPSYNYTYRGSSSGSQPLKETLQ